MIIAVTSLHPSVINTAFLSYLQIFRLLLKTLLFIFLFWDDFPLRYFCRLLYKTCWLFYKTDRFLLLFPSNTFPLRYFRWLLNNTNRLLVRSWNALIFLMHRLRRNLCTIWKVFLQFTGKFIRNILFLYFFAFGLFVFVNSIQPIVQLLLVLLINFKNINEQTASHRYNPKCLL